MKKLMIFVLVLIGLTVAGEVILPQVITQTFGLICSLPGASITLPHWRLGLGILWKTGLVAILGTVTIYIFVGLLRRRRGAL